ncbi:MBG domain-containing protein, partial [Rhodospirillum sp. A1_3_36]|uniref:MBG domain-containing protein n=1 Tax=Rhodospirillum sp. A1_3_36 TaxID=3391666 RepID=UPI0039A47C89
GLSGALATTATTANSVGTYAITQGTLAASSNYTLSYTPGTLTVSARAITVTADNKSRAYGDANPTLTYKVTSGSLVNGDGLSGALATTATTANSVGTYAITQGTLAASSNYTLSYTPGTLTVNKRAITVTADNKSRAYGDANPTLTYSITSGSMVSGESLSGDITTTATTASAVGTYDITQGSLAASSNYSLIYMPGTLTVSARAITVTADSQSRTYGDANPTLTYSLTSGSLPSGESLSGALTTTATSTSAVGTYAITQGTLASANYALTVIPGTLIINPRTITVTANNQSRTYGDTNPPLTYGITSGSLVNGDSLSGALTTTATAANSVGTYGITQGTLAASGNYRLTYAPGTLTIGPRAITVTADNLSRILGDPNPPLTYALTSGSLVNGGGLSGALATIATTASPPGTYAITQGSLANANYALTFTAGSLTIEIPSRSTPQIPSPVIANAPFITATNGTGHLQPQGNSFAPTGNRTVTEDQRLNGPVCFMGAGQALSCGAS